MSKIDIIESPAYGEDRFFNPSRRRFLGWGVATAGLVVAGAKLKIDFDQSTKVKIDKAAVEASTSVAAASHEATHEANRLNDHLDAMRRNSVDYAGRCLPAATLRGMVYFLGNNGQRGYAVQTPLLINSRMGPLIKGNPNSFWVLEQGLRDDKTPLLRPFYLGQSNIELEVDQSRPLEEIYLGCGPATPDFPKGTICAVEPVTQRPIPGIPLPGILVEV